MAQRIWIVLVMAVAGMTAGCNTVEGAGKDIERGGRRSNSRHADRPVAPWPCRAPACAPAFRRPRLSPGIPANPRTRAHHDTPARHACRLPAMARLRPTTLRKFLLTSPARIARMQQ